MTLDQAKKLYRTIDDSNHSHVDWQYILLEMQHVVSAKSDRAAGNVIRWWNCWDRKNTATRCAKQLRENWEKIKHETNTSNTTP